MNTEVASETGRDVFLGNALEGVVREQHSVPSFRTSSLSKDSES